MRRAEEARALGDEFGAQKFMQYAESEGKVFGSIDELMVAYQTNSVHLHNRIALPGLSLIHICSLKRLKKFKKILKKVALNTQKVVNF